PAGGPAPRLWDLPGDQPGVHRLSPSPGGRQAQAAPGASSPASQSTPDRICPTCAARPARDSSLRPGATFSKSTLVSDRRLLTRPRTSARASGPTAVCPPGPSASRTPAAPAPPGAGPSSCLVASSRGSRSFSWRLAPGTLAQQLPVAGRQDRPLVVAEVP